MDDCMICSKAPAQHRTIPTVFGARDLCDTCYVRFGKRPLRRARRKSRTPSRRQKDRKMFYLPGQLCFPFMSHQPWDIDAQTLQISE